MKEAKSISQDSVNKAVVLLLALGIAALCLAAIWQFLLAILLAGIFAGLTYPLYSRLWLLFADRHHLASLETLTIFAMMHGPTPRAPWERAGGQNPGP